jgi:hypothetical protein
MTTTRAKTAKPLTRQAIPSLYYYASDERMDGPNPLMRGDCTGLRGNCTGLRGDCTDLWGDLDLIPAVWRAANIEDFVEEPE